MQSRSRPKTSDGTALGYVFAALAPTGLWASLRGQGDTVWGLAWWQRVGILRRGCCGACVPRTEALALGAWCAQVCGGFAWAVCWLLGCRVTRGDHAREMLYRYVQVSPAVGPLALAHAMSSSSSAASALVMSPRARASRAASASRSGRTCPLHARIASGSAWQDTPS